MLEPWYMKKLNPAKKDLIDYAFQNGSKKSFMDLGGVWGIDAAYTFYTLDKYHVTSAFLVDIGYTNLVLERAKKYPHLKMIKGNFGEDTVIKQLKKVDAIFMFDILLHQVKPDWDQVLDMYAPLTDSYLIFNQQFKATKTTRLLDLGEKEYFANVPHDGTGTAPSYIRLFERLDEMHPEHKKAWKDIPSIWQWGITNNDLITKVTSLGFTLQYLKNCGPFGNLKNFDNYAFMFQKNPEPVKKQDTAEKTATKAQPKPAQFTPATNL